MRIRYITWETVNNILTLSYFSPGISIPFGCICFESSPQPHPGKIPILQYCVFQLPELCDFSNKEKCQGWECIHVDFFKWTWEHNLLRVLAQTQIISNSPRIKVPCSCRWRVCLLCVYNMPYGYHFHLWPQRAREEGGDRSGNKAE